MNYPYQPLVKLLQFFCTPEEYIDVTGQLNWRNAYVYSNQKYKDYWSLIPTYIYARCPICQYEYHEQVDTYHIGAWKTHLSLSSTLYVPDDYPRPKPCSHFLGIHRFINLHHREPDERDYMENRTGEVPYVTPWLFEYGIETYAVLHALPICINNNNQFLPAYTIFCLTYFSSDREELLKRHYAAEAEWGKGDPDYYPTMLYPPNSTQKRLYDLDYWVTNDKLGWLDIESSDLSLLRHSNSRVLPEIYRGIQGNRSSYVWHRGQFRNI